MRRILISCGGTGGHLAPGIALAEGLLARGHVCWLLISRKRVDARLIQKYPHLSFIKTPGAPFSLRPAGFVRFLFEQVRSLFWSMRLLGRLRPDLVIGFGGFSSAGISLAALFRRLPLVLHESNRIPGRAIRFLCRFSPARVYLPEGVGLRRVPSERIRHFGTPVRKEIGGQTKADARARLGIGLEGRLLVILGGSQGAAALNEWAERSFPALAAESVSVFCVTGLSNGGERELEAPTLSGGVARAKFVPFSDRIADLFSAADLVVSRAGAGTIAELIRCRTPAILVPYPFSADDHQRANALYFEEKGGGFLLGQDSLDRLLGEVLRVVSDTVLLEELGRRMEELDREEGLGLIIDDLEKIAGGMKGVRSGRRLRVA